MCISLTGKKKANISRVKSNAASATEKVLVESEYYLNLESEDKKQYEKSQLFQTASFCQTQIYR